MRRRARLSARTLAAFAVLALALGPAIAEARPGGGSSSGSRGSRTYSAPPSTRTAPGTTSPFNRTETPRQAPSPGYSSPGYAQPRPAPSYTTPSRGGLFGGGFMSGLMGGLLGAGLAGILFGHGAYGGMSGGAGFLGFLLQLALIGGLIWLALRLFRNRLPERAPAMAGGAPGAYARTAGDGDGPNRGVGGGAAGPTSRAVPVTEADFSSFESSLVRINDAWSRQDVAALQRLATPEMVRYFEGDLRDLQARGWRNETRDVRLDSGDLSEAWAENGLEYATVAMRFSLVDVTRDAGGRVVEGDPNARQTVTEVWTFARRPREGWLLSAIQQAS